MANQFVVDLGDIKLTAVQRQNINKSIQAAVAVELTKVDLARKLVLIPITKWPKGPIIDGIIARGLDKNLPALLQKEGLM